jgi:hypothetical protein
MCRSIKVLRNADRMPTDEEIEAAALQFVRKISGYRTPSKANQHVFDRAVQEISRCAREMFENLEMRVRV